MTLQPLVDLGRFLNILIYTQPIELLGRGDQPVARPLPTQKNTNAK
jgi:hypothetical protein